MGDEGGKLGDLDTVVGGSLDDTAVSDGPAPRGPAVGDAVPRTRGDSIGRYLVLEKLGAGGMGVVYSAYDPELDRKVAIKLLLPGTFGQADTQGSTRLLREAQAMAKLSHPNVVTVHDVGTVGDSVYVAMEFVAGQTLTRWIAEAPRDWSEIVRVFIEAGRGLAAAHEEGLVHRDFKPDNVMLDHRERVRVMDFGLAATTLTSERDDESTPTLDALGSNLTHAGAIMGTPAYMSPEQLAGASTDARTDQFSFCVALWEALYGERPFGGDTMPELVLAVTSGNRRAPPAGRVVPGWLRRAVERGLAPVSDDRFSSMPDLLAALDRKPTQRRLVWGTAAGAIAIAGALGVLWSQIRAPLCGGASEALEAAWGKERRASVERAVLATELPFAASVWARESAQIDEWSEAWTRMHTDTCEATRLRGEQSEAVMDLRMACLGRARLALEAVVGVLEQPSAQVLGKAHEIVAGLPALQGCEDVEALQAEVAPPPADEADAVQAIAADLARTRARLSAGDHEGARAAVERAEAALEGLVYEPIRTDVWLAKGWTLGELGEYREAEAVLARAQESAARWHQWSALGNATSHLVLVVGVKQGRHAEALRLRELALGLADGSPEMSRAARESLAGVA